MQESHNQWITTSPMSIMNNYIALLNQLANWESISNSSTVEEAVDSYYNLLYGIFYKCTP